VVKKYRVVRVFRGSPHPACGLPKLGLPFLPIECGEGMISFISRGKLLILGRD
jgi:hypothetical protein